MKVISIIILFFFISCNYNIKETHYLGDNCIVVEDYNKILCLDAIIDPNIKYIFIDRNKFQREESKFVELIVYTMMVVDIEKNGINIWVTLSNSTHSIKVLFDESPKIEDIYNVICREKNLSPSVLLKSDGTIVVMQDPVMVETVSEDEISMEP